MLCGEGHSATATSHQQLSVVREGGDVPFVSETGLYG
jgi:hypothetical protein